ncbi:UDP-N-acetylmuramoyl-L-alanine--D-glutamate ligase [Saliniradius amylolyticus]|uniref:UDP-N-acetylmuramoylalanine--D-glutamate ligase n=1 Tax=Saliniradius amylolyticus TaxID=2183582 RepID=A0A2S2E5I7_9ALTE|nr:UDP-N-acetylmuramoyl-L-alanine--D-glutamate ligase [Saliniradius amylolyticus]AWL12924.1 UDP-N-acetylmuramoyl-L-alanine--D-glutamate ligase [Saliniradius amylolyticus]
MTKTMMLKNKRVAVVGLGLTGLSCVRFLHQQGAQVLAMDTRAHLTPELPAGTDVQLGPLDAQSLVSVDFILLSPGLPLSEPALVSARQAGVAILGDIELFARFNKTPVVAITGSNGKSTVTRLVTQMLKASGRKVAEGGNIGRPALELLEDNADVVVLELSSFQLETTDSLAPLAATILNISADHMDRYSSLEDYAAAKQRIYVGAKHCFYNREDRLTWPERPNRQQSFGLSAPETGWGYDPSHDMIIHNSKPLLEFGVCGLVGQHNLLNIQAAAALSLTAGASLEGVVEAATHFTGLPHRCELVRRTQGISWINDSKGTNIGATQAAIDGLAPQVAGRLILIAGGDGKGADFSTLDLSRVQVLICLGKDGQRIAEQHDSAQLVADMNEAVFQASRIAKDGDMVLLSPACASLDMYANYQARGQAFVDAVEAL